MTLDRVIVAAWLLPCLLAVVALPARAEETPDPVEIESVVPSESDAQPRDSVVEGIYKREIIEPFRKPIKAIEPETKLSFMFGPKFGLAAQGHVGSSQAEDIPRYGRGWSASQAVDFSLGIDVGYIGFFIDFAFDVFHSRGTTATSTGWYKYGDIRYFTFCPGLKIKFPYWLRTMYAGDAPWAMEWYDYMLHAHPYLKVGFGPALLNTMEKATDTQPVKLDYWETGLSFTFFASFGMQWMPFGDHVGLFIDAGVQVLVPLSDMGRAGVGEDPENLVTFPIRLGLVIEF